MKHTLYVIAAFLFLAASVHAQQEDKWQKWGPTRGLKEGGFIARVGYVIGGATPIPLPAELRKINEFSPKGGVSLGIDGYRMFSKRWGASLGAHFFWEGIHTSADVKNYYAWLSMDGNVTKGYVTGTNVTNIEMWGVTMPLLVTCRVSPRWNLNFGPYLTYYFKQTFSGETYDTDDGVGYMRVDTPTGDKMLFSRDQPSSYPDDFDKDMLPLGFGIELGFDWKAMRHMNVFGKLDWGLTNIWSPSFEAMSYKMFPVFFTLGVAYRY